MQSNSQISLNSKIKMQSITCMNGFRNQDAVAETKFCLFLGRIKRGGRGETWVGAAGCFRISLRRRCCVWVNGGVPKNPGVERGLGFFCYLGVCWGRF